MIPPLKSDSPVFIPQFTVFNPLFKRVLIRPITPTLAPSFEKNQKDSIHAQILTFLINQNVIDEFGNLKITELNQHLFSESQLGRINQLLLQPIKVKFQNKEFEFFISLKNLFHSLKLHTVEIVGSSVFWLLGKEYMEKICELLKIPEEVLVLLCDFDNPAADLDIRIPYIGDPDLYKILVCKYFATKLVGNKFLEYLREKKIENTEENRIELIYKQAFTKYHTHNPPYNRNHFGIVSFGDSDEFTVDLLFVKSMERENLFKHDKIKITLNHLNTFKQIVNLEGQSILESTILRLTKFLDADNIDQIDLRGSLRLFTYLTKGWSFQSNELESILVAKFLESFDKTLLSNNIQNHFPNNPFASLVFCFNLCQFLPAEKNLFFTVANELIQSKSNIWVENAFLECFYHAMSPLKFEINQARIHFKWIQTYFQIFGQLFLNGNAKHPDLQIFRILINEKPHLQFKFNLTEPLYIVVKDDINTACKDFKELLYTPNIYKSFILKTISSFCQYLNFKESNEIYDPIKSDEAYEADTDLLKTLFEWCEDQIAVVNQLGFSLLCQTGKQENKSNYLTYLLLKLPNLLLNEPSAESRENLVSLFISYWNTTSNLENLDTANFLKTIAQENVKPNEILKAFCITFSTYNSPAVLDFIFNTWETHFKSFDSLSCSVIIHNLKTLNPYLSLKMVRKLCQHQNVDKKDLIPFFETVFNEYRKVKHQALFLRDLELLEDLGFEILSKIEKMKETNDLQSIKSFIELAKHLIPLNFSKGCRLLKKIEATSGFKNGFEYLLKDTHLSQKLELILQWHHKHPLNIKFDQNAFEERVNLLASVAIGMDSDSRIINEIYKLNVKFPTNALALKPKENLPLYELLIKVALANKNLEIAIDWLKKVLTLCHANHLTQFSFDAVYDLCIEEKKHILAKGILDFLEQLWPNEAHALKWKNLILKTLSSETDLKILSPFLKKTTDFIDDIEISAVTKTRITSLLKKPELFKKNKDAFLIITKILQSFRIKDLEILESFIDALKILSDKNLIESAFLTLKEMNVSLLTLNSLFPLLLHVHSEHSLEFLTSTFEIKRNDAYDTITGLLNLLKIKTVDSKEIEKHYLELRSKKTLTTEKQILIDIRYLRASMVREDFLNLKVWEILEDVALKTKKKEHYRDLSDFFITMIASFSENKVKIDQILELKMVRFLMYLETGLDHLIMVPFLNFLTAESSTNLLKVGVSLAYKIIKNCPFDKPSLLTKPYLDFKNTLKKLININFEKKSLCNVSHILSPKFFPVKELFDIHGKISKALFEDPETIKNEFNILIAFEAYLNNIKSPHESAKYAKDNMKGFINCLLAVLFTHKNTTFYYQTLGKILDGIIGYSELPKKNLTPEFPIKALPSVNKEEKKVMNQKIYDFLTSLIQAMIDQIVKNEDLDSISIHVASRQIAHALYLTPYADKKEETIKLLLDFCTAAQMLPKNHIEDWLIEGSMIVEKLTKCGFLFQLRSDEEVEKVFAIYMMTSQSLDCFGDYDEATKAKMIFNIIKLFSLSDAPSAIYLAYTYFGKHLKLLTAHLPDECIELNNVLVNRADQSYFDKSTIL